ncbi:hypothetical protein Rt10032_c03g1326 [Rhodotorula toruloides]|uniref:Zn(2)-C6 fungal-type domain-containing protein n=1 Tax=Rhodotorula toruloides TaxID=5286 RepID=A0A511KAF6_RHOTO|nr:hypothetical protein Rt10032_c03g1326 [Rhodotorula toruloides]
MDGQDAYWEFQQPSQPAVPLHFSSPQTTVYSSSQSPSTGAVPAVYSRDGLQQPYASTSAFVFSPDSQPPPPSSVTASQDPTYAFLGRYDTGVQYEQQLDYAYAAQPPSAVQHDEFGMGTAMNGEGATSNSEGSHEERLSNARMSKKPKPRPPPPQGAIVTDKSCARCRVRKVRCNRIFPRCDHCTARDEECDLKDWKPRPKYKPNDPARVAELEKRLAELEEELAHSRDKPQSGQIDVSAADLDLPSDFSSFRPISSLSAAAGTSAETKDALASLVALTSFWTVGARTSPHSAVLGIAIRPEDPVDHPNAPLLSAGNRRQTACTALFDKAHALNWEAGTMETPTVEALAALLAVLQMSLFTEVQPMKTRPLLRSAVSHYKDLQDAASNESEAAWIRKTFGFAIYTADCLISAYARRKCHIADSDLPTYFAHADTKIILPRLPMDSLLPIAQKLVKAISSRVSALKSAKHLLACWVCACQRAFVQFAAPTGSARKTAEDLAGGLLQLWNAIDSTRAAAAYLLELSPPTLHNHVHNPSEPQHTVHEHDYGAQFIRLDRDLLDLINLIHVEVEARRAILPPQLPGESLSRVRKALRRRAFYLHAYVVGADIHMAFHEVYQLEHLPNWTKLALQRVGEPGGPLSADEQVTETELSWFIEGLQHACYFHPLSEKRLVELAPRFGPLDAKVDLSPRFTQLDLSGGQSQKPSLSKSRKQTPHPDPTIRLPVPLDPLLSPSQASYSSPSFASSALFGTSTTALVPDTSLPDLAATSSPLSVAPTSLPINFDRWSPLSFGDTGLGGLPTFEEIDGAFGWSGGLEGGGSNVVIKNFRLLGPMLRPLPT